MAGKLFSSNKKVNILAIENDRDNIAIIREFCILYEFSLDLSPNQEDAIKKLNRTFYQIILFNAGIPEGNNNLVRHIRHVRGYGQVPILVITRNREHAHISALLESGADGYIISPFGIDVLQAHFNLFLRRSLFEKTNVNERLKKDLNTEKGCIVLCATSKQILDIPLNTIEATVIPVINEEELFDTLEQENVWTILIGTRANWALPLVPRIKNNPRLDLQITLLREKNVLDADVVDFFNNGGDDITSVNKPLFILARQINSRIERELQIKKKYINALKTAAQKLPVRFQPRVKVRYGNLALDILHRSSQELPGGDFYEIINLEGTGRLLLLGDVMGKNWEAWYFSLAYLAYMRSMVKNLARQHDLDPSHYLFELNNILYHDLRLSEVFTTLTVVIFTDQDNKVKIASAAGLPVYVIRKDSPVTMEYKAKGTLLGLSANSDFEMLELELEEKDRLFLCTDGYLEARTEAARPPGGKAMAGAMSDALRMYDDLDEADKYLTQKHHLEFQDDRTWICFTQLSAK